MNNSKVMLCLRCSSMFDEKATKGIETAKPSYPRKGSRGGSTSRFIFDKRGVPHRSQDFQKKSGNRQWTYVPPSNAHKEE